MNAQEWWKHLRGLNKSRPDDVEKKILANLAAEESRSEMFSGIVTDVASALGLGPGESTNNLGERVAENLNDWYIGWKKMLARAEAAEAALNRMREKMDKPEVPYTEEYES